MAKNLWIKDSALMNKAKSKFLEKHPEKTNAYDYDVVEEALRNYIQND